MKTRIKVETLINGNKVYTPQYRSFFLWCNARNLCENIITYSTQQQAMAHIDNNYKANVHLTSYIQYPWGQY